MRHAISRSLGIDDSELDFSFVRASGPGGQNVNKLSTAAQLRFALMASPGLPADVKARAARLGKRWLTDEGEMLIIAQRFRTQERNREDALERLLAMLRAAAEQPVARKATRPSKAAKARRVDRKTRHGALKKQRQARPETE